MATHTVKQSGGDFTTLASALSDSGTGDGDTISIEGTWTVNDTAAATISNSSIDILTDASSKHPGYVDTSQNHYRLVVSTDHAITNYYSGLVIDGLVIQQAGTGSSLEGIRFDNAGTMTIKNSIIWADTQSNDQDGIYIDGATSTVNLENCVFYGWHRAAIRDHGDGITINANSCTIWDGGTDSDVDDSGAYIADYTGSAVNTFNCIGLDCNIHANAADYNGDGTFDIHNSIDSDGSIAVQDSGAVGSLGSRSSTDNASPGAGDWVIFEDITSSPYDLRLQDNATDNDAQEMHTASSGAGMSMPATDIAGNTRSSPYCCGAYHVVSGSTSVPALLMINGQIKQYLDESPNSPLCLESNGSVQAYSDVTGKDPLVMDAGTKRVLGVGETLSH